MGHSDPHVQTCCQVSEHVCCYREEAIIDIFERNTNSVANVFDVTLQVISQAVSHTAAQPACAAI